MEKNHNNQNTNRPQGMNHNEEKKTDGQTGQTKKPETNEPTQKPTTSHTK